MFGGDLFSVFDENDDVAEVDENKESNNIASDDKSGALKKRIK